MAHGLAWLSRTLGPTDGGRQWAKERALIKLAEAPGAWEGVQAIVLGNSHAGSIDPAAMGLRGLHLNRAGGDLFETERALATWLPRAPNLKWVLVSLSYFSFGYDNAASPATVRNRIAFYDNNANARPVEGDLQNFALGRLQPLFPSLYLLRGDAWEGVGRGAAGRFRHRVPLTEIEGIEVEAVEDLAVEDLIEFGAVQDGPESIVAGACDPRSPSDLAAHAGIRITTYGDYLEAMLASDPAIPQRAEAAIRSIVRQARAAGAEAVFVTPPYSRAYREAFAAALPGTLADFHARRERLATETGARMLDRSDALSPADDPAAFRDSDHLNPCGAADFGRLLAEDLAVSGP
jgi:hypothetical protein